MDGDGRERDKDDKKKLEEEIVGVSKMVLTVNKYETSLKGFSIWRLFL